MQLDHWIRSYEEARFIKKQRGPDGDLDQDGPERYDGTRGGSKRKQIAL